MLTIETRSVSIGRMETVIAPVSLPSVSAAVLSELEWTVENSIELPARPSLVAPRSYPPLAEPARRMIDRLAGSLWKHQWAALELWSAGCEPALLTSPGSGKSMVFMAAAADLLYANPGARVLVFYPTKALAYEQRERWKASLSAAGFIEPVSLLTGDEPDFKRRLAALRAARVALLTPDVLHADLLPRLGNRSLRQIIGSVRLAILDEAHTFSGAFGTHTAYLLRRLSLHVERCGGSPLRWFAASGTLADPAAHLTRLTGVNFSLVGADDDGSPRYTRRLHFVRSKPGSDILGGLGSWVRRLAMEEPSPFAVFPQSRIQTELIADIGTRPAPATDNAQTIIDRAGRRVAPYRAGLSPAERREIEEKFRRGELRGLICTSALELGIDLPGLTTGILFGLPDSPAGFQQRLGRFARHSDGDIFIIDDGGPSCRDAFANPQGLLKAPPPDACLYLENERIVAQHVLCFASEAEAFGEIDSLELHRRFPAAFAETYSQLQRGEPGEPLRHLRDDAGDAPHLTFALRHCDRRYALESERGDISGDLSFAQVLREAYPGAVYRHNGRPWRILRIDHRRGRILVRPERSYFTRPTIVPASIVPDLAGGVFSGWKVSDLTVVEARVDVTERVEGFSERRGAGITETHDYGDGSGRWGQLGPLRRRYTTTGVVIFHPALDTPRFDCTAAASFLKDALLLIHPLERREINGACGRLRTARLNQSAGTRFLALYDETPGSLRLTRRLAEPESLRAVLSKALELARRETPSLDTTGTALARIFTAAVGPTQPVSDFPKREAPAPNKFIRPGFSGWHPVLERAFRVLRIKKDFTGQIVYVCHPFDKPASDDTVGELPIDSLIELPGETVWCNPTEIGTDLP